MHRRQHILAAALAASLLLIVPAGGWAADTIRITGPVAHQNLAIYFVHGSSVVGKVPLTLDEALAKNVVKVHETGDVNELFIENFGKEEVFVHSGAIVKGGQQDRVLTISLVLPPNSGRVPISAFCVEQGRWSARGREDSKTFATASAMLPSHRAKMAMRAPAPKPDPAWPRTGMSLSAIHPSEPTPLIDTTGSRQQQVWSAVAATQGKLSDHLGAAVASARSQTSLQLSLENEKLKAAQDGYMKALLPTGESDGDIIGYVFAINGKINSADIYPSNGLFRKLWSKLLAANATEAIGERHATSDGAPTIEAVQAFLDAAEHGKASENALPVANRQQTRESDNALFFETRRADGTWTHRSYLAK